MPTSERGNETIPIANDEFMGEIVHGDPGEARHIVVSFPGDPRGVSSSAWQGQPWTSDIELSPTHNNFVSLSSFVHDANGEYRRLKEQFYALHVIVLDDIGSKVDPGLIHLPPSYKIETSLNNYQWGFILREPERDAVLVNALMNAAIAARLSDKGMTQPSTRLVRLPVGMNGKDGKHFQCHLDDWHPERRFSTEDLIRGLGLDLDSTPRRRQQSQGSHAPGLGNPTGSIEPLLSRLERVRQLSPDSFLACCPGHDDQHPSLSIKMTLDKLLLHCFAGCSVSSICTALGIEMKDLFLDTGYKTNRTPHSASTAASSERTNMNDDGPTGDSKASSDGEALETTILDEVKPISKPSSASSSSKAMDKHAQNQHKTGTSDPPWPVIDPAAFHGVIGNFVKAVEPYSEADPVGLLLHTLQGFGCLIGRGPHVMVEHLAHHARLNVLLVGKTANARKGTAWSTPKLMFRKIDEMLKEEWVKNRVRSGLSSGEGLIYNVRDSEGDDPGETDKRLLIIEQEFAGALQAMRREGNTLSARIRDAWDHGTLTPMTKRDRLTATDAHICIMGHITVTELLRLLTETEQVNGFANRFLVALVRRSKFLPSGQGAPLELLEEYLSPLSRIAERGKERGELKRDAEAEALWSKVYPKLEQEIPGLSGSILARGAAQVLRLSLLYCLSDHEEAELAHPAIREPHLLAALGVWDYCKASVQYIFGDAIGDPVADRLLRLLKTGPQTGNDLYEAMGKHGGDRDQKERALELLSRLGLAHTIKIPTPGRSIEEWHYGATRTCQTCAIRVKRGD